LRLPTGTGTISLSRAAWRSSFYGRRLVARRGRFVGSIPVTRRSSGTIAVARSTARRRRGVARGGWIAGAGIGLWAIVPSQRQVDRRNVTFVSSNYRLGRSCRSFVGLEIATGRGHKSRDDEKHGYSSHGKASFCSKSK